MNHIQLTIQANEQEQEILISLFSDMNATGFEQLADQLIAYFDENNFNKEEIDKLLTNHSFTIEKIAAQNWNQLWESNFQPVIVDDFCAIRADFHQPVPGVKYEIIITPKMSFGTGHHATTYMMIQQMQKLNLVDKEVFDFGTGTGILAILAEKLGAASITAIDNDEWSINNAWENIERNKCKHIELYQASQVPTDRLFDIVLANINRNVILENISNLFTILTEDGKLLLSGLLLNDEAVITNACEKMGLILNQKMQQQNWISLLFVKEK